MANGDELSRPADVGKLVEDVDVIIADLRQLGFRKAADALTALSSAPVDAGAEELAKRLNSIANFLNANGLHDDAASIREAIRAIATERQAIEKARAEIEAAKRDEMSGYGYFAYKRALSILAQHVPAQGVGK